MKEFTAEEIAQADKESGGLLTALEGASHTMRLSTALFISIGHHMKNRKMTDEQFFDLFMAGMEAHRIASVDSFMCDVFFKDDAAVEKMKKQGGVSTTTMGRIALTTHTQVQKSAERFLNLTQMLTGA